MGFGKELIAVCHRTGGAFFIGKVVKKSWVMNGIEKIVAIHLFLVKV